MGSNREVIEDPPEVDSASEIDVQTDAQVDDTETQEVLLGDDKEAEAAPSGAGAELEIEKENARGRARGRAGSRASGREAGETSRLLWGAAFLAMAVAAAAGGTAHGKQLGTAVHL